MAGQGRSSFLTLRSLAVGTAVGTLMCSSNMYFGLQSGWITCGSLQAAILGFGIFKAFQKCGLGRNFTPEENVIIQTTSMAIATMPSTAGFVSVIPALGLLTIADNPSDGPVILSTSKLIFWTLSVAFFGVFVALPLRQQTIVKEKLEFPTGTATAKVIQLLHETDESHIYNRLEAVESSHGSGDAADDIECNAQPVHAFEIEHGSNEEQTEVVDSADSSSMDWQTSLRVLLNSVAISFFYKIISEWVVVGGEQILSVFPVFSWLGWETATRWGWVFYPSTGYIGQGMIMGPRTCVSMFIGSVMGYAVLGPIARWCGWAPGDIYNMEIGAAGWVLWVSLAIMLGDSLTSLALLAMGTAYKSRMERKRLERKIVEKGDVKLFWWISGLLLSSVWCAAIVSPLFSMPIYQPFMAVAIACVVSVLSVRALGETDLNPASSIGKISQIIFSFVAAGQVVPNIIAGAVAEAGGIQSGDMMQDFKTAYILGLQPRPQLYAQLIGSFLSSFISVGVYCLYTSAWEIPSQELPVPAAQIWIDMARLFNGGALPENVWIFALVFGLVAAFGAIAQEVVKLNGARVVLPSGIGFAVGMFLGPKYVIPRLLGSFIEQGWKRANPKTHVALKVVLASGLVLGEGTASILVAFVKALFAIA